MGNDERLWTVPEVAAYLRVTEDTVRRWLRERRMTGTMMGGRTAGYRIPTREVERVKAEGPWARFMWKGGNDVPSYFSRADVRDVRTDEAGDTLVTLRVPPDHWLVGAVDQSEEDVREQLREAKDVVTERDAERDRD